MLMAVAANGPQVEGEIQHHAARAPYYLLFDASATLLEAIANPYCEAGHAVAPKVAALLAGKGVSELVAAELGPRFEAELVERDIDFVQKEGDIPGYLHERFGG